MDVRGQMTLPLGGREYVLRPSYEAILEIERELRPLPVLADAARRAALTYDEMGVIAAILMRAHGETLKPRDPGALGYQGASAEKVSKLIYGEGGPKACVRIAVVLINAINGGYTAEGEAKTAEIGKA